MPRNRYTKLVRVRERNQIARQRVDADRIAEELSKGIEPNPARFIGDGKARRWERLAHRRKHKPKRFTVVEATT
jgi:hypothetical protein